MSIPFVKQHGLGNDFVVIDARPGLISLSAAAVRAIADRRLGVGCDQLIVIEPPRSTGTDAFMRIRNADGGEVGACGNASRCVAARLMAERGSAHICIETIAGMLDCTAAAGGAVTVDMGRARLDWSEIPLAAPCDTLHVPVALGPLADPVAVNVGNPHAVFFVPDAEAVDLAALGPPLEHHTLFPEQANIEVVHRLGPDRLRMRVWERGVGITRACGTGACAAAVAACRRNVTGGSVEVVLDGGSLHIAWRDDGHVLMTGPVATSFTGELGPALTAMLD